MTYMDDPENISVSIAKFWCLLYPNPLNPFVKIIFTTCFVCHKVEYEKIYYYAKYVLAKYMCIYVCKAKSLKMH
jgi:hypothetical protein